MNEDVMPIPNLPTLDYLLRNSGARDTVFTSMGKDPRYENKRTMSTYKFGSKAGDVEKKDVVVGDPILNPTIGDYLKSMVAQYPVSTVAQSAVRKKLGIPYNEVRTEGNLNPTNYNGIVNLVRQTLADPTSYSKSGDTYIPNLSVLYGKYAPANTSIDKVFGTGKDYVQYILGGFNFRKVPGGYIVRDTYDFNEGQGQYKGSDSWYAKARRLAGKAAHKNTDPDSIKMKHSVFIPDYLLEKEADESLINGIGKSLLNTFIPFNR